MQSLYARLKHVDYAMLVPHWNLTLLVPQLMDELSILQSIDFTEVVNCKVRPVVVPLAAAPRRSSVSISRLASEVAQWRASWRACGVESLVRFVVQRGHRVHKLSWQA